ncbi:MULTISPECIES: sarcosine oxidase subunit alpha family protein [Rhizobium]|uniref:Sarcosine oxidase subunit alpha n=1 Tax=Rhizobium tropici TaxID=398 RepID=A0A6P1C8S3_RHITR|nr:MULTISPECIES: sarcosine oxidase subunit alpha family protein [Rhizobium]AGB75654.1 sarcosine oxidase subunit alpha (sarcosine oxidase subunit A) [Rhizobium tropici CIAT 899]MBB4245456.1 sarcosine oxidase subunit alpha [Rhizobium tropici]MBB5595765.1 sarcosine oxidase subunit alpha [Rhizobium tropici]MBB6495807.1 sarcosine oxidase subunit alpha [Rhizobium tropici]NEV12861.1 sarcosine oxidase subunit alpha family protein [Rhizobium tropici]
MSSYRLSSGGRIDRSKTIAFSFDGRSLEGHPGDTLASALLANGIQLVGRSFKYHRPRGILTAGAAEPNALVTTGTGGRTEANSRATMIELHDGLIARSQNRWPSLNFDVGAVNGLLSPFLSAGFYYKTFMWPAAFWEKVYEPLIRKAAGLGKASYEADPDSYEKCWAHCDLLVIGAGPAGLAAALTAGRAGARVILADEGFALGGSLLLERNSPLKDMLDELDSLPNVQRMPRTTVIGWYDDNVFGAVERVQKHVAAPDRRQPVERLWRIIAKQAILATGAEERPLVFGGNDIPGVMMASAMRSYLNRQAVAPGKRTVVFTTNSSGYRTAADLEAAGVDVVAIVDTRAAGEHWGGKARVLTGACVLDAVGTKQVRGVKIASGSGTHEIDADALAMSGGWSPIIHLACHRGARPVWSERHAAFLAPERQEGLLIAGSASGPASTDSCLGDGAIKAAEALETIGFGKIAPAFASAAEEVPAVAARLWHIKGSKGKAFVDYQNDVNLKDLGLAVREGYGDVELAKRYTTNGMATDQGKLSNINAIGILAEARGVSPAEVGTSTFRPFYTPVSFGALTGTSRAKHFQPARKSPLHEWAKKNGAVFVETGLWYRSSWFPRDGEKTWRESVDREVLNIRKNAGICDVSTLGKIEIFGKDAATFLDRIYCNGFAKLSVGKARYGIMLREDGMIYDDGTTSRLSEDHFFMTTTTALAAGVLTHLEFCAQTLWPELEVYFASSTDQWAQMAVAGPNSRTILSEIVDDDISDAAFPFMSARAVSLFGGKLEGRLFRISFSGELAYELGVPAAYGEFVADAIMQAGRKHGICAYGAEALGVMRIEKGHVTHAEINGTVTPGDLGFGRMVSTTKPDFIGKAMLAREGLQAPDRPRLVGVKPLDPATSFRTGAHILAEGAAATLENDQGYVTSSAFSPNLGHTIGLALIKNGPERIGEKIVVWNGLRNEYTDAVICSPVFIDPQNEKLHA